MRTGSPRGPPISGKIVSFRISKGYSSRNHSVSFVVMASMTRTLRLAEELRSSKFSRAPSVGAFTSSMMRLRRLRIR